jgi:hypothetical protein
MNMHIVILCVNKWSFSIKRKYKKHSTVYFSFIFHIFCELFACITVLLKKAMPSYNTKRVFIEDIYIIILHL